MIPGGRPRDGAALALALAALAVAPGDLLAQGRWSAGASAGLALPAGDLADYQDLGASLEATVGYRLTPRVRVRLLAARHPLPGSDWSNVEPVELAGGAEQGPDGTFTYLLAGAAVPATDPREGGWSILAVAGVGAAHLDLEPSVASPGGSFTQPAAGGGAEVAYPLGDGLELVGRSTAMVFFRTTGPPEQIGGRFGDEITFAHTAGLRVRF